MGLRSALKDQAVSSHGSSKMIQFEAPQRAVGYVQIGTDPQDLETRYAITSSASNYHFGTPKPHLHVLILTAVLRISDPGWTGSDSSHAIPHKMVTSRHQDAIDTCSFGLDLKRSAGPASSKRPCFEPETPLICRHLRSPIGGGK